jgi:hypothetical protein
VPGSLSFSSQLLGQAIAFVAQSTWGLFCAVKAKLISFYCSACVTNRTSGNPRTTSFGDYSQLQPRAPRCIAMAVYTLRTTLAASAQLLSAFGVEYNNGACAASSWQARTIANAGSAVFHPFDPNCPSCLPQFDVFH